MILLIQTLRNLKRESEDFKTKAQKNLIAVGLVILGGWLFWNYDDSKDKAKKAKKQIAKEVKTQKRKASAARNKSLVDVLRVSAPLLTPVVNVAVDEFKAYRKR